VLQFRFKLRKAAPEMHKMLKTALSDKAMGKTQAWFPQFKNGKMFVEDCLHSGHSSTGHTEKKKCRKFTK
jgi:hypothetical protein